MSKQHDFKKYLGKLFLPKVNVLLSLKNQGLPLNHSSARAISSAWKNCDATISGKVVFYCTLIRKKDYVTFKYSSLNNRNINCL